VPRGVGHEHEVVLCMVQQRNFDESHPDHRSGRERFPAHRLSDPIVARPVRNPTVYAGRVTAINPNLARLR